MPAVERIEVLVDPASAAHGADSIGGIVNIILRSEIPDPAAEVHYGTAAGGASQSRLSLSGGFHRDDVSATLVMDYFELRDLIGSERALWRDQDYRRFGGPDQRSLLASPGNITSLTSDFLPGLSSRVAAVPTGSVGNTIEDFIPTAGQFNHESLAHHLSIVPQARRFSATGMIEWKLNERLSASAEVVYADRSADFQATPPIVADAVPATNAFNPFGATVFVQSLLSEVGPQRQNVETKLLRAVAAVRGALWKWRWEVSVLDTQEDAWAWTDNVLDS